MSSDRLHPVVRWCHRIALWLFVLITWGVALFFVIDFWPLISQLTLSQVLTTLILFLVITLIGILLWMGRIVTIGQVMKFCAVMFFFIAMAVLYSYVGMKLGLFIRDLVGLERMTAVLG